MLIIVSVARDNDEMNDIFFLQISKPNDWNSFTNQLLPQLNLKPTEQIKHVYVSAEVDLLISKDTTRLVDKQFLGIIISECQIGHLERALNLMQQASRESLIEGKEWCLVSSEWCNLVAKVLLFLFIGTPSYSTVLVMMLLSIFYRGLIQVQFPIIC